MRALDAYSGLWVLLTWTIIYANAATETEKNSSKKSLASKLKLGRNPRLVNSVGSRSLDEKRQFFLKRRETNNFGSINNGLENPVSTNLADSGDTGAQVIGAFANLPPPKDAANKEIFGDRQTFNQRPFSKEKNLLSRERSFFPDSTNENTGQGVDSRRTQTGDRFDASRDRSRPNIISGFPSVNSIPSSNFEGNEVAVKGNSIIVNSDPRLNTQSITDITGFTDTTGFRSKFNINRLPDTQDNFQRMGPIIIHRGSDVDGSPIFFELDNERGTSVLSGAPGGGRFGPVFTTIHGSPGNPDIVIPHTFDNGRTMADSSIVFGQNLGFPGNNMPPIILHSDIPNRKDDKSDRRGETGGIRIELDESKFQRERPNFQRTGLNSHSEQPNFHRKQTNFPRKEQNIQTNRENSQGNKIPHHPFRSRPSVIQIPASNFPRTNQNMPVGDFFMSDSKPFNPNGIPNSRPFNPSETLSSRRFNPNRISFRPGTGVALDTSLRNFSPDNSNFFPLNDNFDLRRNFTDKPQKLFPSARKSINGEPNHRNSNKQFHRDSPAHRNSNRQFQRESQIAKTWEPSNINRFSSSDKNSKSDSSRGTYSYGYAVNAPSTGDHKAAYEEKDAFGTVRGQYGLSQPDGKFRLVTYQAEKDTGFTADVDFI